ncbi:MAG TPA: GNAT family N-acetyltransferase [Parvularculaceae bacterium]|nr:GNAT family N-acetyltransferase [Parvularculaceae bacterium]
MTFCWRLAERADIPKLLALMEAAIDGLLPAFLSPDEVEASHAVMGLDTQLIEDGTYFVIVKEGRLVGCGGWSRRATMHGGDHSAGRNAAQLDPAKDAARIRAMYVRPDFARRGVGRLILSLGERAAAQAGFSRLILGATLAGEPLYRACGFVETDRGGEMTASGVFVPIVLMEKAIDRAAAERIIAGAVE